MKRLTLIITALFLLCGTASSQGWVDCVSEDPRNKVRTNGGAICFDMVRDGTLTSNIMWFGYCKNGVTVQFASDIKGSGATTTGTFYSCAANTASTDCCVALDTGMVNGDRIEKKHVTWGYAVGTTNPGVGEQVRFIAHCE